MHFWRTKRRAASWLRRSLWWPIALATLDKLDHMSPHPFSRCKCFRRGQIMMRAPTFATNRSFVRLQLRKSQNTSVSSCLLSLGTSSEFKHSAIDGAISSMAVSRSLRFRPSAAIVPLSSLFINMQTAHSSSFLHLSVTLAMSLPSSSQIPYGQSWSLSLSEGRWVASGLHVHSVLRALHTSANLWWTFSVRSMLYCWRAAFCLASWMVCLSTAVACSA